MTKFAPFVLLAVFAGCLDTNINGGDVGTGTSGTATVTGGSGLQPSGSGSSSGGNVAGSTGSSSGGATTGGATTGGTTLEQACTDYYNGAVHIDQCSGATGPDGTIEQCEEILVVCTAQDDQILDDIGLCFEGLACDSTNLELGVLGCAGEIKGMSPACIAAGAAGAGGQPP